MIDAESSTPGKSPAVVPHTSKNAASVWPHFDNEAVVANKPEPAAPAGQEMDPGMMGENEVTT